MPAGAHFLSCVAVKATDVTSCEGHAQQVHLGVSRVLGYELYTVHNYGRTGTFCEFCKYRTLCENIFRVQFIMPVNLHFRTKF